MAVTNVWAQHHVLHVLHAHAQWCMEEYARTGNKGVCWNGQM